MTKTIVKKPQPKVLVTGDIVTEEIEVFENLDEVTSKPEEAKEEPQKP